MITEIRNATQRDAPDIAQILSHWIDETEWMPKIHSNDEHQAFGAFLVEKTQVSVAISNKETVGFLALQAQSIQAFYLAAGWRRRGIGRHLLEDAKSKHNKLFLWTFLANNGARRFYLREGFVEVQRGDGSGNDENLPDVQFCWNRVMSDG